MLTMVSNPRRFRSRYWNFHAFENMVNNAGAVLHVVEVAYGERHFEITDPSNPNHLQLRTIHEIWHKENAINVLAARLPQDAKYVAWIDSDVQFTRTDWAQETMQLLQHYEFLQMFKYAQDLGPNCEPIGTPTEGFVFKWITQPPTPEQIRELRCGDDPGYPYPPYGKGWRGLFGHSGYCWAARRSALDKVGMLIDWAAMGSADWHMAMGLVGLADLTLRGGYSATYKEWVKVWQDRAERHIRRNIGCMPGLINHYFHGDKSLRKYATRWKALVSCGYDPEKDIKRDWQGLYQLEDWGHARSRKFRDSIQRYNESRDEDSIVVKD